MIMILTIVWIFKLDLLNDLNDVLSADPVLTSALLQWPELPLSAVR